MPCKPRAPGDDRRSRLNATAGDAAALLMAQLRAFADPASESLHRWQASRDDLFAAAHHLGEALQLAEISAKLGETLARMKGESRQTISVERVALPGTSAPKRVRAQRAKPLAEQGILRMRRLCQREGVCRER